MQFKYIKRVFIKYTFFSLKNGYICIVRLNFICIFVIPHTIISILYKNSNKKLDFLFDIQKFIFIFVLSKINNN